MNPMHGPGPTEWDGFAEKCLYLEFPSYRWEWNP